MEKQATNTPVTDDQELANVLAGMNGQAAASATDDNKPADDPAAADLQYEETGDKAQVSDQTPAEEPVTEEVAAVPTLDELEKTVAADAAETPELDSPAPTPDGQATTTSLSPELDSLKKDAVAELRPLVDKLDLPADEKFDTLLLIIRS
ncbi:MAG TPA: hypothetical protein VFG56_01045, partial [Candidatus Saccharimonadales bacterium]|nr:hypothetical protein [Candidatus Saccharimonadales bacterium]